MLPERDEGAAMYPTSIMVAAVIADVNSTVARCGR